MAYREKVSRAKLFMPFDALKGFREALAAKEHIVVPKIELSEEMLEELDSKFKELQPGMMVSIVHYEKDEYIKTTGMIAKISISSRLIQVVNIKIDFDYICSIELLRGGYCF